MTRPRGVSRGTGPLAAPRSWLAMGALALLVSIGDGATHPTSQGALELRLGPKSLRVTARVPVEQVLIAETVADADAKMEDLWPRHGAYLLRHLQVAADGTPLTGTVTRVVGAESVRAGMALYELEYPLATPPVRLSLYQDLLREIEYAPGNRWEATYLVRLVREGRPAVQGAPGTTGAGPGASSQDLLLASGRTLDIYCGAGSNGGRWRLFGDYVRHGVAHILGGYDHLLFIMALALATVTFWDLIKVISSFTLAHSVTLTLAVLDIVRLPSRIVEPMIAASIVVVAFSNVLWPRRSRGWARLVTAFAFGLFHGLGFAGGLLDAMAGTTGVAVGVAILGFSLGVETGHQMVVLPVFFGLRLVRASGADASRRERLSLLLRRGGSLAVGAAGMVYLAAALRQSLF